MHSKPLPSMKGALHVQVKFSLVGPSLEQLALTSHGPGSDKQGSGTEIYMVDSLRTQLAFQ